MICSIVIHSQNVPSIGGIILFDIMVTYFGSGAIPVYAEIYPIIGDCAQGTVFDFDINRMITANLNGYETFIGQYFYAPGDVSGLGLSSAAIYVDAGPAIDDWWASCCDEFMFYNPWSRIGSPTVSWNTEFFERSDLNANLPVATILGNNYPNPFNATTTIPFELPMDSDVSLKVYNLSGQLVEVLVDDFMQAGNHFANWDASAYSSGVYFFKLDSGGNIFIKRMALIK